MRSRNRARASLQARERRLGLLLLAPGLGLLAAASAYPALAVLWLSLRQRVVIFGIDRFAGIENYLRLAADDRFWRSVQTTLYFAGASVAVEMVLGLLIALALRRGPRGQGLARAAFLLPWVIPAVVAAKMWEWIFHPTSGLMNYLLRPATWANPINWLGDTSLAIHAAILLEVWRGTPFVILLLLAGLQAIPEDLYAAGAVDGADGVRAFWHITLPLLRPILTVVLLFRGLDGLRAFDGIYVLTNGGPANTTETLAIYAYKVLFQTLQFGYGSAIATVAFTGVLALAVGYLRTVGRPLTEE